jgi:hypothetical protein
MNMRTVSIVLVLTWGAALPSAVRAEDAKGVSAGLEFFEKKIRPLLVDNCYNCHSANTNAKGGLRVDDRNGLLHGGNTGPAIVAGNPEKSLLLRAVGYKDEDLQMPPKKQLTAEQVADLTAWIKDGAAWPAVGVPMSLGKANPKYDKLKKEHWAWQPLSAVTPPQLKDASWARSDIDRYVLGKLEQAGLKPSGDADKTTLIRRVTFDLTGLPPTPEEIDAFVNDETPGAFEHLVDRLLASPAFGERWGRHWLDVARFGESTGSSRNVPYPHAWKYRDYVIDAFNSDKPYDQFIREQIAGDLLPAKSQAERDTHLIATGFLALGVKDVNQRFKERFVMDNIDEQIDTVSRSVLALTASCARCHDHKFDPIPTSDYYALAGIFNSTDLCAGVRNKMGGAGLAYYDTAMLVRLGEPSKSAASPDEIEKLSNEAEKARAEFRKLRGTPEGTKRDPDGFPHQRQFRLKAEELEAKLAALTDPAKLGEIALGVREAKTIGDTEVRVRGEAEKLGPVVPRGFLSVLNVPDAAKINASQSGRLELAQWLTSEKNPLTPRVLANRVWEHLFGQGLVKSVDNFGTTGDVPSNPQLLDYLAGEFVHDGWSVKKLVRTVVLSRAYRLSSEGTPENLAADPADRLVWRHNPRRLDAEEIRDATLVASGQLDHSRPQGSIAKDLQVRELRNNGPEAARFGEAARASVHRSVYLPLLRGLTPTSLEVFDFAEQGMVTGSRDTTTVATQALYLLNDPFVRKQSLALADRLLGRSEMDEGERIDLAYRLTLGRSATPGEVERAKRYLAEFEVAAKDVIATPAVASKPQPPIVVADAAAATESGAEEAPQAGSGTPQAPTVAKPAAGGKRKKPDQDGDQKPTQTAQAKPAQPINPDEAVNADEPVKEEAISVKNPRTAAWASFTQALLGTAEFRYLK